MSIPILWGKGLRYPTFPGAYFVLMKRAQQELPENQSQEVLGFGAVCHHGLIAMQDLATQCNECPL